MVDKHLSKNPWSTYNIIKLEPALSIVTSANSQLKTTQLNHRCNRKNFKFKNIRYLKHLAMVESTDRRFSRSSTLQKTLVKSKRLNH